MATYQGKEVRARPARQGDKGFDAAKEQVIVTLPNGEERTVAKAEVQEDA